jgi:hypothetical protein
MALEAAFSERKHIGACVRELRQHVAEHFVMMRARHVTGAIFNVIADHLSHLRIAEARCLVLSVFGKPLRLVSSGGMKL